MSRTIRRKNSKPNKSWLRDWVKIDGVYQPLSLSDKEIKKVNTLFHSDSWHKTGLYNQRTDVLHRCLCKHEISKYLKDYEYEIQIRSKRYREYD